MKKQILIIDDEEAVCWALEQAIKREGHRATVCATAEKGLSAAKSETPDAIILDVRLPGMDGLTALEHFQSQWPSVPVIVITAHGNLETAVQAVEGGAFDYLTKPFDLSQAIQTVERALQQSTSKDNTEAEVTQTPGEIVGQSQVMQNVFKRIALVAGRDTCALITGESGTGKELVARAIHRHSPRRHGPFLPIHIAALNPSLVESELFGHVKGAFTGANDARPGLLELAKGGTVFLDELAEIPLSVQVKLLRALEQNEVFPVGSNTPISLDIRILAATNQDLSSHVSDGKFRHDLFFRLNVFQITLPPLRDRKEDIPLLIEHFLSRFETPTKEISPETLRYLQSLPWFGNVRELRNALEHAAIVARGQSLLREHFPPGISQIGTRSPAEQIQDSTRQWIAEQIQSASPSAPESLHEQILRIVEMSLLEDILTRVDGNRLVAAQWLGLNRATVRKKLEMYDLTDIHEEKRQDED